MRRERRQTCESAFRQLLSILLLTRNRERSILCLASHIVKNEGHFSIVPEYASTESTENEETNDTAENGILLFHGLAIALPALILRNR